MTDYELVAKWEVIKYTISYDLAQGFWGEVEGATEFAHGTKVTLVNPVRNGYEFVGWYVGEVKVEEINENAQTDAQKIKYRARL